MRYLSVEHVLELHRLVVAGSGGASGLRDRNALESAVSQSLMTFEGTDLYPTVAAKAAALAHSLIQNHPFSMETSVLATRDGSVSSPKRR